jgi:LAS superfamily LD-carboxypeptidase LdcB
MAWSDGVHPTLVAWVNALIAAASRAGILVTPTSGVRTYRQQAALYRRYLAGLNPYPVAPPGTSDHELGKAVDLWAGDSPRTQVIGRAWKAAGGAWSPSDEVHFHLSSL